MASRCIIALLCHVFLLIRPIRSSFDCYDYYSPGSPLYCTPPLQDNIAIDVTPVATSTCGIAGPEQICSLGSIHSCEVCTSVDQHSPQYMTDGLDDTYWQSQTYANIEDGVNITLSLGKSHYITEISITFQSPRPESLAILVSNDHGTSYTPLQYYSQSCYETYNIAQEGENSEGVRCVSEDTEVIPLSGGQVTYMTDPSWWYQTHVTATDLLITLDRLNTLGNELTWSNDGLNSYSFAISSLSIRGGCFCNGHASECINNGSGLACACEHNTNGTDCELCLPSHNDLQWMPILAESIEPFSCKVCDCSNRSDECFFDAQTFTTSGNVSGGICIDCTNNTAGARCERCAEGFYPMNPDSTQLECTACVCDPRGILGGDGTCETAVTVFNSSNGMCPCKPNVNGVTCNVCRDGYFGLTVNNDCLECNCNSDGSISHVCNDITGQCVCKIGYYGRTCEACNCNANGTIDPSLQCDVNGNCGRCKEGYDGAKCNVCQSTYFNSDNGICTSCACNANGSVSVSCDDITGQCDCRDGYSGVDCSVCPDGYHNIGNGCEECPNCYKAVTNDFTAAEYLLSELKVQINRTLSMFQFHTDLINLVNTTESSLTELLNMFKSLIQREIILQEALNQTEVDLNVKMSSLNEHSIIFRELELFSATAETSVNMSRTEINGLVNSITLVRNELLRVQGNLSDALRLLEAIALLRNELVRIANVSNVTSREQSNLIESLKVELQVILNDTSTTLFEISDALETEDSTLIRLTNMDNITINELDELFLMAQSLLQSAAVNASEVMNRSVVVYDAILSIVIPDYNIEQLSNTSDALFETAYYYDDSLSMITNDTDFMEDLLAIHNTTFQNLSSTVEYLNSTAVDLIQRARMALLKANSSSTAAEEVITDIYSIFNQLQMLLDEFLKFVAEYDDLLYIVRKAENISADAVDEADRQAAEVLQIANVTAHIDAALVMIMDNLENASKIILDANLTIFNALNNTQSIDRDLQRFSNEIDTENSTLTSLEDRAVRDSETITTADRAVNRTRDKVNLLNVDLQQLQSEINRLELSIENVILIPESRFGDLQNVMDTMEEKFGLMEKDVEDLTVEIVELQEQSDDLLKKFNELRQYRDLLIDVRSSIENLRCEENIN